VKSNHATDNGRLRQLALLGTALIASMAMLFSIASSASALSLGLMWTGNPAQTPTEMDVVGKSGASLFRIPMEPARAQSGDWSYYDSIFGPAAENGITILPHFGGTRLSGTLGIPQPSEKEAWSAWAKEAVRRYGYNGVFWSSHPSIPAHPVIAWEMWNEPNNTSLGGSISATEFGTFLSWAGAAVQSASQSWGGQTTGVLFGGLLAWSGGTSYQTYLKNAYNVAGAASAITGVAFHPYELDMSQFPGKSRLEAFTTAVNGARTFINTLSGGSSKSLWITETSWPAEAEYAVGEAEAASLLTQSVNWIKASAAALNIHAMIWYNYRDLPSPAIWQYRSGLRDNTGKYRSAWYAFQEETGAPRWPTAELPEPVKGEDEFQGPHPVAQADGTDDIFFRTTTNGLGHDWFRPGIGWASTTEAGPTLASDPHPVPHPNGAMDVFFRTTTNGLGHDWFRPGIGWASTTEAGPNLASDPYPIAQSNGVVDIFFRTTTNGLGHDWFNPGVGWASTTEAGPTLASDPHPLLHSDGSVDVFFRTTTGGLGHDWFRPGIGWASTTEAGPMLASDPHPVLHSDGTVDVFFRTTTNGLGHDWFRPGIGWASTTEAGPALASDPHPLLQLNGVVDIFFRTTTNGLGHDWFNPSTGWASTTEAGPALASEPHVQTMSDGTVNAFFRTTTGGLGHDWFRPGIGWASTTEVGPALKALELPKATTEAASGFKATSATLSGTVNPEGSPTGYYFEYGTTTSYGSKAPASAESVGYGTSGVAVSQALGGLAEGTTYHYRVVATSEAGTTSGSDKTFTTEVQSIPAIATVLSDGKMLAKTGSLTGTAVDESIAGVKILRTSVAAVSGTAVFAAYGENQHVYVKQGLNGTWIDEGGEMKSMSVAVDATNGPYVGVVTNAGQAMVKQGISGSWVNQMAGSSSISLATDTKNGPLVGVLGTNGHAYVKQGSLTASFVDEASAVKALSLATDSNNGALIGILTTGGVAVVKQGGLLASWVEEYGGVQALSLASDSTNNLLLGVITNSGEALVKQGSLTGTWVNEASGIVALDLGSDSTKGPLIGVRTGTGHAYVKQGSLGGAWVDQMVSTSVVAMAISG
jgi:hypothetical protein